MPQQDPPNPQTTVVNTSTGDNAARYGIYTDAALTTRRPVNDDVPASDQPPPVGNKTGGVRSAYAIDRADETANTAAAEENQDVDPPPHAPNKWEMQTRNGRRVRRDPYSNDGVADYLNNN